MIFNTDQYPFGSLTYEGLFTFDGFSQNNWRGYQAVMGGDTKAGGDHCGGSCELLITDQAIQIIIKFILIDHHW